METLELGIDGVRIRHHGHGFLSEAYKRPLALDVSHPENVKAMIDLATTSSDRSPELLQNTSSEIDNLAWDWNARLAKEVGVVRPAHPGPAAG